MEGFNYSGPAVSVNLEPAKFPCVLTLQTVFHVASSGLGTLFKAFGRPHMVTFGFWGENRYLKAFKSLQRAGDSFPSPKKDF